MKSETGRGIRAVRTARRSPFQDSQWCFRFGGKNNHDDVIADPLIAVNYSTVDSFLTHTCYNSYSTVLGP